MMRSGLGARLLPVAAMVVAGAWGWACVGPAGHESDGFYARHQADRGAVVFEERCADCHSTGLGAPPPEGLSGDAFVARWQSVAGLYAPIARAMLKDPPIFLFDEVTSSLDSITEKELFADLFENLADKTVLVISHRLSFASQADKVMILNEGGVEAIGPHRDLMKSSMFYRDLFGQSVQGRIDRQLALA